MSLGLAARLLPYLIRRRQHLAHDLLYVGFGCPVIHDAGAQREVTLDPRIGQIHAASLCNSLEDRAIQRIRIAFTGAEPETHGTEGYGCETFELRLAVDGACKQLRQA